MIKYKKLSSLYEVNEFVKCFQGARLVPIIHDNKFIVEYNCVEITFYDLSLLLYHHKITIPEYLMGIDLKNIILKEKLHLTSDPYERLIEKIEIGHSSKLKICQNDQILTKKYTCMKYVKNDEILTSIILYETDDFKEAFNWHIDIYDGLLVPKGNDLSNILTELSEPLYIQHLRFLGE